MPSVINNVTIICNCSLCIPWDLAFHFLSGCRNDFSSWKTNIILTLFFLCPHQNPSPREEGIFPTPHSQYVPAEPNEGTAYPFIPPTVNTTHQLPKYTLPPLSLFPTNDLRPFRVLKRKSKLIRHVHIFVSTFS